MKRRRISGLLAQESRENQNIEYCFSFSRNVFALCLLFGCYGQQKLMKSAGGINVELVRQVLEF